MKISWLQYLTRLYCFIFLFLCSTNFVSGQTLPLIGTLGSADQAEMSTATYIYKNDYPVTITFDLTPHIYEIADKMKSSAKTLGNALYLRWNIEAKDGVTTVDLNNWTFSNTGWNLYKLYQQGYISTTTAPGDLLNTWGNGIKILSISVTLPSGLSWDDYYVTCYLANDITGYNYNNSTSLLESEPSIFALKYTFDLARLISTDFQHNYSPGGDLYSRDQVVEANGHRYQKTRTWTYQLYANPGETINLVLPLENMYNNSGGVSTGSGNNLEPHAYYRWYNYQTDAIDINSTPFINDGTKKLLSYPWGYMAYDYGTSNFVYSDVGVLNYTVPAEFLDDGVVIACDVSDYKDYGLTRDGVFFKEPTLSLRYIFQIKPASVMADEIKQVTKPDQFLFLENYGYMTLNCATDALNDNTEFTLRVEQRLPQDYFFYPATQVNYLSAISSWDQASLTKATAIYWCVVDKNGSLIKNNIFSNDLRQHRFFTFTRNDLSGIPYEEEFYVYAYAVSCNPNADWNSITQKAPIAFYRCRFAPDKPIQESDNLYVNRSAEYLNDHYMLGAEINFDQVDEAGKSFDYEAPSLLNNVGKLPYGVSNNYYGFVYPTLADYKATISNGWADRFTPLHGEYGYYKSANLPGVSQPSDGYAWYANSVLYDRSYMTSGGKRYGYFMYIDASDESRPLASTVIDAELCTQSTVIFTAWIADMTSGGIKPQVMFRIYGVNDDGTEKLLHNTLSGIVNNGAGTWAQIYSEVRLQPNGEGVPYKKYRVSIDNFCKGTSGADYAIDDIRIYIKSAKVDVIQTTIPCGENHVNVNIQASFNELINLLELPANESKVLYYKIIDKNGNILSAKYQNSPEEIEMGQKIFHADFLLNDAQNITEDSNGNRFFIFESSLNIELDSQKDYFLTIGYEDNGNVIWGDPNDPCSIISELFRLKQQGIEITDLYGNTLTSYRIECGVDKIELKELNATLVIPRSDGTTMRVDGLHFDWYCGNVLPDGMKEAMGAFRTTVYYPNDFSNPSLRGIIGDTYFDLLNDNATNLFFKTNKLDDHFLQLGDNVFYLFVVETSVSNPLGAGNIALCDQSMKIIIPLISDGIPILDLGFADIDYTKIGYGSSTLRMGHQHISDLKEAKANLYIPVKEFNNESVRSKTPLADLKLKVGDEYLNLIWTDDPTYNSPLLQDMIRNEVFAVAKIVSLGAKRNSKDYVVFDFSDVTLKSFAVHEGYTYKLKFNFSNDPNTADADSEVSDCSSFTTLDIKIVPEYMVFNGGDNWNRDTNWKRATQNDLFKDTHTNTDDYKDYPLTAGDGLEYKGFVPMDFTKVVLMEGNIPWLYELKIEPSTKVLDMENVQGEAATDNIEYDMLIGSISGNQLKCVPFYGNRCKEIYFKTNAELWNQHFLQYDKAWVDVELTANRWYMLASPLCGVVAGDMYLPLDNRRQETEAFAPILFDGSLQSNDRALLPVYQRSWDKAGSFVLKENGDKYDAYIAAKASWTHVYNDVAVDYSVQGFSIKADRKELDGTTGDDKVLFRLPKSDTQYRYFAYEDTDNPVNSAEHLADIARTNAGKLRTCLAADGVVEVDLVTNAHLDNNLYVVGNPYMAAIDMSEFFLINSDLEAKYWMVTADEQLTYALINGLGIIAPMQAFFVKPQVDKTVASVKFTPGMQVTNMAPSSYRPTLTRSLNEGGSIDGSYLRITATANDKKSSILIYTDPIAKQEFIADEDVEALFDSNVPDNLLLYSIAGRRATTIQGVPQIETIPLGISIAKEEIIELYFEGIDKLDSPIYLYDIETESSQLIKEGDIINVTGASVGRYFLQNHSADTTIDAKNVIVKVVGNNVEISSLREDILEFVMVYDINGRLCVNEYIDGRQCLVQLPQHGVYLLHLKVGNKNDSHKIYIGNSE